MNNIIQLWNQAGEKPYEALIEEGLYDEFLSILQQQSHQLNQVLYRGLYNTTIESLDLNYPYPTSWTYDEVVASYFADKYLILRLTTSTIIPAIDTSNYCVDYYNENEVIIAPMKLRIVKIEGNIIDVTID